MASTLAKSCVRVILILSVILFILSIDVMINRNVSFHVVVQDLDTHTNPNASSLVSDQGYSYDNSVVYHTLSVIHTPTEPVDQQSTTSHAHLHFQHVAPVSCFQFLPRQFSLLLILCTLDLSSLS